MIVEAGGAGALPGWAGEMLPPAAAEFAGRMLRFIEATSAGLLHSEAVASIVGLCLLMVAVDFARRGFRVVWPRRKVEGTFATLAILVANLFFGPFVALAAAAFQRGYDGLGVPRVDPGFWAGVPRVDPGFWAGVPAWALVPLAIFAYDFANYWNHRAMHMRWLWPVHAVHHSDPEMTGLTTFRVHVFETLVMMGSYTLLLSWLGFPPNVMGSAAVLLGLLNAYVHVDVDWGHGPFRLIIASPRFHKWHHADTPAAYGKNLANIFPFLDVAFGTYRVPGPCTLPLGAAGVPENDVVRLLLYPFTAWGRMARGALGWVPRRGIRRQAATGA